MGSCLIGRMLGGVESFAVPLAKEVGPMWHLHWWATVLERATSMEGGFLFRQWGLFLV